MVERTFICTYGHENTAKVGTDVFHILCPECGMMANLKTKEDDMSYFTSVASGTVHMGNAKTWLNH